MKRCCPFVTAAILAALMSTPAAAQENVYDASPVITGVPANTPVFTLRNGGYDKTNWEIVFGYVNKSWVCTYKSGTQREDFFGDPDVKYLHGIQFGALFTPSFDWGLGLRSGLMFEGYTSRSKWITAWCNHFSEADLYIPLHASYRIPFEEEIGLNIYGGIGFQWAMQGKYVKQVGTVWPGGWWWRRPIPVLMSEKHEYGNGGPQRVNWQAECGVNFRFKHFMLNFTYSFGIVDHGIQNTFDDGQTYVTASRSRQDKMQASIAFTF